MKTHTLLQDKKLILSVLANMEMTFGNRLRQWRKAKGMTQEELALAVGVNPSYISNLERNFSATTKSGTPRPSEGLVEKFAKVLSVDLDEIRNAAGYASKQTIAVIPKRVLEAYAREGTLSESDNDLIANLIESLKDKNK